MITKLYLKTGFFEAARYNDRKAASNTNWFKNQAVEKG